MNVGRHDLGRENRTFIIAEAGSNHNGNLDTARSLIDAAADAGVDAVKFQLFDADTLIVEQSGSDPGLDPDRSIHDAFADLELPQTWLPELHDHCTRRDVLFMATPFDEAAVEALSEYVPAYKIASSTMTHLPFLERVAATEKPLIVSTGAHELAEVRSAVETLRTNGAKDLALLHCVSAYPTPINEINVRALDTLGEEFGVPVGLSDHTEDPVVAPCAAVSRGAVIVEKHFTLDRSMDGPDHSFALEPAELAEMVHRIRQTEAALGDERVTVQEREHLTYERARRAVHATKEIAPGERITEENTAVLRPGKRERGASPSEYRALLGAKAVTNIDKDDGVRWSDVDEEPPEESGR